MIRKTHKCPTAMRKTAKRESVRLQKRHFSYFFFLRYDHCSNNDNSKTVQVLTVILSQNLCLSQRGAIRSLSVFIAPNSPWSIKLFRALTDCCPFHRTPFSNVVRMHTHSLVPKLKTTVIGLGARLAHVKSRVDQRSIRLVWSLPVVVAKAYAVHTT